MSASSKPTKFVEEPHALLCPVCGRVFSEPVISIKCGHTFCRGCIVGMVKDGGRCPVDKQECDSGQLVLNRAVMGQIDDLKIYCCHGLRSRNGGKTWETDPDGCKEVINLGGRDDHEVNCQFTKTVCPIGGDVCGVLRLNQMDRHVANCGRVPCPFSNFGCLYHGTAGEVADHRSNCSYRDESQLLVITMRELKLVKESNKELQASNKELQQSFSQTLKAIDKLVAERAAQAEQQALTITAITAITSRMDKLEESMMSMSQRSEKVEETLRSWTSYSRYTNSSAGTPVIRERSTRDKRWSIESATSLVSNHDNKPFVWQMPFTVKCIGTFRGHKGTIWSLLAHANWLFSSSSDGTIKVWDIADLRNGCVKTVSAHKDCAMTLAASRGVLYSSGTDLALRSWHVDTMEEVGAVEKAHDSMISAMVCSKQYLFTSSLGCIKVWDLLSLKVVHSTDNISQSWIRALAYDKRAVGKQLP
jgi:E3 ubiquitin-protein ligase TRAF7